MRGLVTFPRLPIKDTYYQYDLSLNVDMDHLAEAVFARFLHCKLTFPPPFHTLNDQGFMLFLLKVRVIYKNSLKLYCIENFSHFHFIDSIICFYEYGLINIYFILWFKFNTILILLLKLSQLWPLAALSVFLYFLNVHQCEVVFCLFFFWTLPHFLALHHTPVLKSAISPGDFVSFIG